MHGLQHRPEHLTIPGVVQFQNQLIAPDNNSINQNRLGTAQQPLIRTALTWGKRSQYPETVLPTNLECSQAAHT
jgi:hypothetical protein